MGTFEFHLNEYVVFCTFRRGETKNINWCVIKQNKTENRANENVVI